ncbi:hypothetical protein [Candidatus Hodgkinia cicadicola]|uniref:hypothetical protein n=1 Tax=Candidatus Hodgkinia cicadicola TaxID=573658 RepID=UPI0011BACBD0
MALLKRVIDLNLINVHTNIIYGVTINNKFTTVITTSGWDFCIADIVPSECCGRYDVSSSGFYKGSDYRFLYKKLTQIVIDERWLKFCEALIRLGFKYTT